jgi:adenylosuccinate synthase
MFNDAWQECDFTQRSGTIDCSEEEAVGLWIVIGGQFGSEGKGKVSAHIALSEDIDICVRCGGPNSGHSFLTENRSRVLLRQLPTGVVRPATRLLIPAGGLVDLAVLHHEIKDFGLDSRRVGVDRNAMILEHADREVETRLGMTERLSSTQSGVGSAVARRALRQTDVRLARDVKDAWFSKLITDVADECNSALDVEKKVLIEGTQGFGLSLYHSVHYPKTTARDTSAAGFLSEVGLSPLSATEIVAVFRTFPIRVAGLQAGPLKDEIDWDTLQRESGYPSAIREYTSVTNKVRRVARFDWDLARHTVDRNRPTRIAVMGLDYLDYRDYGKEHFAELTRRSHRFIERFQSEVGEISYLGTGPALEDCFPLTQGSGLSIDHHHPVSA